MADTDADSSISERVFRVGNRPLMFVAFGIAIASIVPLSSLHELMTTGTIDMDAVSSGRREIPVWLLYVSAWAIFLLTLWVARPVLYYVWHREMFRLTPQGMVIRGIILAPDDVLGFRYSFLRGHVMRSTRGEIPIHPWAVSGAVEALNEFLPHLPPLMTAPKS